MGVFSSLCNNVIDFGTKNSNKRTRKITKITPHHMAGIMSADDCARMHYKGSSSANYYIGPNGEITGGVSEDRRAWTSSSPDNDQQAITIEVSNSTGKPDWKISDAAYNSLVRLCADICRRYGIEPHYNGSKTGTITEHYMFAATACPGPYLRKIIESCRFEQDILTYIPTFRYRSHQQTYGWLPWVTCGEISGHTGESRRLESIVIDGGQYFNFQYMVHQQTYGDSAWISNGGNAGVPGESLRLEGFAVKCYDNDKKPIPILYRGHLQTLGWTKWYSNGEYCGTRGESRRLEAIQIKLGG